MAMVSHITLTWTAFSVHLPHQRKVTEIGREQTICSALTCQSVGLISVITWDKPMVPMHS